MKYNWQQSDWPEFRYDTLAVNDTLYQFIEQMGRLSGVLKALPVDTQMAAIINTNPDQMNRYLPDSKD